jgi:transcriptional regulator with XRE-family HTH domain
MMSKLRKVRERNGLTKTELAAASGISVRTVDRAECGVSITIVTWNKILNGLNSRASGHKYSLREIKD